VTVKGTLRDAADPPYEQPVQVKRYARSRFYDTAAGRYLTVENLRHWTATGMRFTVIDVETGEDVTRVLLA
jgi:polyhydroxyalkanoate synthesis regulator protein